MKRWLKLVSFSILALACLPFFFPQIFVRGHGVDQAAWCRNNIDQINAAITQWAFEHKKPDGTLVTTNDILPYLPHGEMPQCPIGGHYVLTMVGAMPRCSMPAKEHKIVY